MRIVLATLALIVSASVLGFLHNPTAQTCSSGSGRFLSANIQTCSGTSSTEIKTASQNYQGKVDTSCQNSNWTSTSTGWLPSPNGFAASGTGQCGNAGAGQPPQCSVLFSDPIATFTGSGGTWTVAVNATSLLVTTSGLCQNNGGDIATYNVFGEECTGSYCCGQSTQCTNSGGDFYAPACSCTLNPTPIILDLNGDGVAMTDLAHGVLFDITGSGVAQRVSWTAKGADDAFLALDRNGNGVIDDARELFGNVTPQAPSATPNGFEALRLLDTNGDGIISKEDAQFDQLLLWTDLNHNGVSEPNELSTLSQHGIVSISLKYRKSVHRDQYGNWFRFYSKVDGPVGRFAYDVYLLIARNEPTSTQQQ